MQRVLVTGANGFIGAHVVRAALKRQLDVRVLVRPNSDRRNLEGLTVDICEGDLTDHESLDRAVAGVDTLFHVGARYDLSRRGRSAIWRANVDGTRALMQSALRHGLERVVHTSSVAAVGPPLDPRQPADERQWASLGAAPGPYEATKIASEQLVHELVASEGLPAVTTLPTAPIGPLDLKPTPTGRLIADASRGTMPAYIRSSGLNIVHVSDVAEGHLLAAEQIEQGQVGERYLLGHAEGNLTLREIITCAAAAGGVEPPRLALPTSLAYAAAVIDEYIVSVLRNQPPRATIAGVRLARRRQWFDPSKSIRDLALPQTPLEQAFADAVDWFKGVSLEAR